MSEEQFAISNRLILRDLNALGRNLATTFYKYTKDDVAKFLKNPEKYEKQLRLAINQIYNASPHFRRLIQYFAGLSDLAYVVSPYRIDTASAKPKTIRSNYRKVISTLTAMDIKNQFPKILKVCLRDDVFYGTFRVSSDSIIIQQLPSDYCKIAVVENNVLNVSFNFSLFDSYPLLLANYPTEFEAKYKLYLNNRSGMKWQELDAPYSFAVKCSDDILEYPVPPFAGVLREIYDIEDYKDLKLTKTALENYAILVMKLGISKEGEWTMDFNKAQDFWSNLDSVLPEEVGSVLSPMDIEKIDFDKSNVSTTNTIADAEQSLFSAAGVSSLLFNNEKASSNSLALSIKADQAITYGIVKGIEGVLNRFIQHQNYGKYFKVTFLDCSSYNRKELGDSYLKACQFGLPMVSYYCASQGLLQSEMDCMNFLEDTVLQIKDRFIPLLNSSTISSDTIEKARGTPRKEADELSDSGEASRENE